MTTQTDIAEIAAVAQLYFEGTHDSDAAKMEAAFAPDIQIVGRTFRRDRDAWIASVAERRSPASQGAPFAYEIQAIDVAGDIATARLSTPISGATFTDAMILIRGEDGRWRVHAKAFVKT